MLNRQIDSFLGLESEYKNAKVVLFGAPFDGTTSYRPGTRFGSNAIRRESYGIESYSPYQDRDAADYAFFDSGDIDLSIGDTERALKQIEERTATILKDKKIPFMLGGEHLVTLGSMRAIVKEYPDVHIVHFDAHADLREDYLGNTLSHATVLRRCYDLIGSGKIYQFGIRSGTKEEFQFAKVHTHIFPFHLEDVAKEIEKLKGKPVYFTVDLDVLDPSIFPGTGTPEAGGVTFEKLREACYIVAKNCNIIGLDVNELSPPYDASGISTVLACKIVRELLITVLSKEEK